LLLFFKKEDSSFMNLFAVPASQSFLDVLAKHWLAAVDDPSHGLLLLPSRRAARALAGAFLRATDGRPLLLPRIIGIGALDEAPLALDGALDLPPPVEPAERLAVLTRLILALDGRYGAPRSADRAWPLAAELASLMDEAEQSEIDLRVALRAAPVEGFAIHWQKILDFLSIVTGMWPNWLAESGLANPADRLNRLLDAQAAAWAAEPPDMPVWAAGFSSGIPATFRLLRQIATMPNSRVIVPGLDLVMSEAAWQSLPPSHAQDGLRRLLNGIGARRGDAEVWGAPVPAGRATTLNRALLPASELADWRSPGTLDLDGLYRLDPADQQEEALSIALILRGALETPGARAALITPDRTLASRVAAELRRFGITADDSAGMPLAHSPQAAFLRLLAVACNERLAPVPLLALLKHPLAAAGLAPADCRTRARVLERACLRGPRPGPGIDNLIGTLGDKTTEPLSDLLRRLDTILSPLLELPDKVLPRAMVTTLIEAAEALATTDAEPGANHLWSGEAGEALSTHLGAILPALDALSEQPADTLPGLLDALLENAVVRSAAHHGAEHPRIFIWGLLEARLQNVELAILGGLAETVWPPATDPGPWMSRQMRQSIGLPSPEERIGTAAADFFAAAGAAPTAILAGPRRRDGAPTVPARWLARLDALLAGAGHRLPRHPAVAWAQALDLPAAATRLAPPRPRPAVALRPRRLAITEVETWLRDPYGIYARHILRLKKLDPIDEVADPSDYGMVVHDGLNRFLHDIGATWPDDAHHRLRDAMDAALSAAGLRPVLRAWWRPRLRRIADWVIAEETRRRADRPPAEIFAECAGTWHLEGPAGPFQLRGRADRIERLADGSLIILDYKTGTPPTTSQVRAGLAPQLPLEAAMAWEGAFDAQHGAGGEPAGLVYWHLSGGFQPGKIIDIERGNAEKLSDLVCLVQDQLMRLIEAYDDPGRAYLSRPNPGRAPRFSDYEQLARVAEWAALDDADFAEAEA
jgi:ATP-dependent helicase/nuclease subunit B